ncbi:MAG TPA: carbohydrate-binding protein [Cytophagales bacterium]|nr:carbohydrate-binding protein [Cytophagales bacterium]
METPKQFSGLKHLFSFLLILLTLGSLQAQTPVSQNGQLQVIGNKLCNQYGNPIQLRGMSTHGIQWYYQCLPDAALDALAYDWGSDVLRISLYVQEGGYETDPAGYTAKVNSLIEKATSRGMYALVDWHQLTPGDPNDNLANAKAFFTDIANAHKNKNNIIYDIANEPNNVTWNRIKIYADQMIPFIRAIDSDAVILCGTHGWGSLGVSDGGSTQDILNNPINHPNFMYTFHFYAASHDNLYYNEFDYASDRLPIFVTEWGSQTASGDGTNNFTMSQKYIDLMRAKKISWTNWNFSDDFRSGAVWQTGTCPNGPWTTAQLKPAGTWVRDKMLNPADDFPGGNTNTPPTVSITGPSNGANFTAPATINITATASDANGTVSSVAFYNGSQHLGTDSSTPYSYNWTNVSAGSYTITAVATDNGNAQTTSSQINVTVSSVTTGQPIPGKIEAESYSAMNGVQKEGTSDEGAGENVGWIDTGDWMDFSVNVQTSGSYTIGYRVASLNGGGSIQLRSGSTTLATTGVPSTGDWQAWTTVNATNVSLTAGTQTLRIYAGAGGFNLNWIQFTGGTTCTPTTIAPYLSVNGGTWQQTSTATLNAGGSVTLGPQPLTGGSWSWTGPNGFTATTREISRNNIQANQGGNYVATHTNAGGCTSTHTFTITVNTVQAGQTIPGKIESESYTAMNGVQEESTTDDGAGENVGWIDAGDWMDYVVNVQTSGSYTVNYRVASESGGGSIQLRSGTTTLATTGVAATGNWQAWTTLSANVSLNAGNQTLRIYASAGGFNLNWIQFSTTSGNTPPAVSLSAPANGSTYSAPASVIITANASDANGQVTQVAFYNGSQLLGTDNSSPYSYSWTNVAAGTYTITARATDNGGAVTTSASKSITVNGFTGSCSGKPQYVENGGYIAGSQVQNNGSLYQCKPDPYSGWCNGASWAYGPGTGTYWTDAWILVSSCSSARLEPSSVESIPNPTNGSTVVEANLASSGPTRLVVYDRLGRQIAVLVNEYLEKGKHTFPIDADKYPAGLYIIKLFNNDEVVNSRLSKQ